MVGIPSLNEDASDDEVGGFTSSSVVLNISNYLLSSKSSFFLSLLNRPHFVEAKEDVPSVRVPRGALPACIELIKYIYAGCAPVSDMAFL